MEAEGSLNEWLERNIERWTQPSSFMVVFTRRAQNLSRFVRQAKKFILEHTGE